MARAEGGYAGSGANGFKTVFVVVGVDDSDELDEEGAELELVMAAIRPYKRN